MKVSHTFPQPHIKIIYIRESFACRQNTISLHYVTIVAYENDWIEINWASEASPTLGCSIEISRDWASEASPTLGCSIEISRDIMSVCMSVVVQKA